MIGVDHKHWGNSIPDQEKFAVLGLRDWFNIQRPTVHFPEIVALVPQNQREISEWHRMIMSASAIQETEKLPDFFRGMTLVQRNRYTAKKRSVTVYNAHGEARTVKVEAGKKIQDDMHLLYGEVDASHKKVFIPAMSFTGKCDVRIVSFSGPNSHVGELSKAESGKFLYSTVEHTGLLANPIKLIGATVDKEFLASIADKYSELSRLGFVVDRYSKLTGIGYQQFLDVVFKSVPETVGEALRMIKAFLDSAADKRTLKDIEAFLSGVNSIRGYSYVSLAKFVELIQPLKDNQRIFRVVKDDVGSIVRDLKERKVDTVRIQEITADGAMSSAYLMKLFQVAEKVVRIRCVRM